MQWVCVFVFWGEDEGLGRYIYIYILGVRVIVFVFVSSACMRVCRGVFRWLIARLSFLDLTCRRGPRFPLRTVDGSAAPIGWRGMPRVSGCSRLFSARVVIAPNQFLLVSFLSAPSPLSRQAFIDGYSLTTQVGAVRELISLVPQFDVVYDELTPIEHLDLHSGTPCAVVPRVCSCL